MAFHIRLSYLAPIWIAQLAIKPTIRIRGTVHLFDQPARNLSCSLVRQKPSSTRHFPVRKLRALAVAYDDRVAVAIPMAFSYLAWIALGCRCDLNDFSVDF